MEAGRLRHLIRIQAKAVVEDAEGGFEETWSTVATVWAECSPRTPIATDEAASSGQVKLRTVWNVSLRYVSWLTASHRILFGNLVLNISGMQQVDGDTREWRLACIEGMDNG